LQRGDVMSWQRIPVTTPARTLLDLAAVVSPDVLRRAVRQAEVDGLARQRELERQLARAPRRRRGSRRLAAILELGPARTRSELEDRMLALLVAHGFPRPLTNAHVRALTRTVEVDFLFPELRLVLETDGDRYHGTRLAREADAARQADLEAAGYRVVRLNWRQVTAEQEQTVRRLRRIVGDQAPS
jgi:very-short-patch-repair endonuclease